jgi:hypothetical protein
MTTRLPLAAQLGAALVALGVAGGCSILNQFDAVAPLVEAAAGDTNPPTDSGAGDSADAHEASADASDSGAPPDGSTPEAGGDAIADVAAEAMDAEAGPRGVVVVGGEVQGDAGAEFVLTALDPQTGAELLNAREPMLVSAVVYDPARDLWYIFESGGAGIYPLPTDPFYFHVRTLDPVNGTWTELQKTTIPTGVSYLTTAALNKSVVYLAYGTSPEAGTGDAGVAIPLPYGLVTLDTTTPSAVTVAGAAPLPLTPTGIVGIPSMAGLGGVADLGSTSMGTSQITPVLLSTGVPNIMTTIAGAPTSGAGFGTVLLNNASTTNLLNLLVATTKPPALTLYGEYGTENATGVFAPFTDSVIRPPSFSYCSQVAFVVGGNGDTAVHAVALPGPAFPAASDGGPGSLPSFAADTGHSGQAVYFEPFTSTVLAPFSQGDNFVLSAFTFDGTPTAPHLSARMAPLWLPPPTLRPNFIATRTPSSFTCPVGGDQ